MNATVPNLHVSPAELDHLASPKAVRERARRVYDLALKGGTHFAVREDRLPSVAEYVLRVTRENYPDGRIPFHSRWEHFRAGGVDRVTDFNQRLGQASKRERARAQIDLALTSVLLDAGAGGQWRYHEGPSGFYSRSEGLAVASYHLFLSGALSSDPHQPLRADADGLANLDEAELARAFQVARDNPLVGVEGRTQLLNRLAEACRAHPEYFLAGEAAGSKPRPGNLIDYYFTIARDGVLPATEILKSLLFGLSEMWPARVCVNGWGFGDAWPYAGLGTGFQGLVAFHKLSQWLAYSLIEPCEEAGLEVRGVHELTGLPEYRNGGLLLDLGAIELRDPSQREIAHKPGSELVIEWRALTIVCLDRIGEIVREKLGKTAEELPLAKVLQGGTWAAGRKVAAEKRGDGSPPLKIDSDGTVF